MRSIGRGNSFCRWLVGGCLLALLGLASCGGGEDGPAQGEVGGSVSVERAFLTGMVHHHETAIEMAQIAERRGTSTFVKGLAGDIVSTQEREMGQMKAIHERLFKSALEPDAGAHEGLGLSAEEAGMTHDASTNKALEAADPFDRAFVDEMVPHHRGAVRMAGVVLKKTRDPELRRLAKAIIATQEREVDQMDAFRTKRFGGPVPRMQDGGDEMGSEHGGH